MARVVVNDECIDIRVSMLERMVLSERSRKVPLSRVRNVNPHPPLLDMMVHWADQGNVWLGGVSAYEGHMIPSTRNPKSTLAIDVEDEPRMFIEVDGESPEHVAERISRAMGSQPPAAPSTPPPPSEARISQLALEIARVQRLEEDDMEGEDYELDQQRRDPLHQGGYGSLPPPAHHPSVPAPPLRLDDDRDLARLGGWLLALGTFGVITGAVIVAAGAIPGLLAVGAGVICGVFGGVALAVVAHHQG
ncbi:MAG TPA: hypothetical protein VFZ61_33975 [Polyangiales bacterium]